jgi:hypothetical protein
VTKYTFHYIEFEEYTTIFADLQFIVVLCMIQHILISCITQEYDDHWKPEQKYKHLSDGYLPLYELLYVWYMYIMHLSNFKTNKGSKGVH